MSFFGGASTNTSQSNTGTSTSTGANTSLTQGSNTASTTPNIPQWYSSFLSSLPGQMNSLGATLSQNSQTPLYGPQQQAAFQNNLNQTQGQANQALQSQLASQGALNSGRAVQADTSLALGGQQQLSNYLAQVPALNAQNSLANTSQLSSLLGQMAGFTSPISAFGSTQTGTTGQTGSTSATNTVGQAGASTGTGQTVPNLAGGLTLSGLQAILPVILNGITGAGSGGSIDWGSLLGGILGGGGS